MEIRRLPDQGGTAVCCCDSLKVGLKAPADWARMLLGELESLRNVCPLMRNLDDPSIIGNVGATQSDI